MDYKHGKGVEVSAERNPQMMCYALGSIRMFDGLYDIESIWMIIFQPRLSNISEYTISKADLLTWAQDTLVPAAKLAHAGEGTFCAGAHCQFCRIKATCRKRAEYNLELARYDFEMPPTLEDAEVEAILAKADTLAAWVSDIKEYTPQRWTGIQKDSLIDGHIRQYREVLLPQQRTDRESYICCVSLLRQASGADTKEKAAEVLFDSVSGDMVEQES